VKVPAGISSSFIPIVLTTSLGWPPVAAAADGSSAGEPGCASTCCGHNRTATTNRQSNRQQQPEIPHGQLRKQISTCAKPERKDPLDKYHRFVVSQSIEPPAWPC
jgi:hypothetical protein